MTETPKGAPRPTTGDKTVDHALAIIRREAEKQQILAARRQAQAETLLRWGLTKEGGAQ